jgi:hypothetical protein
MPRPTIEALREAWRTQLFSTESWTASSARDIPPGEAGGFLVENAIAPFGAYLKPRMVKNDGTPRAANEKIVADLAYELKMSVPPVVLYNRQPVTAGEETRCCLSLLMYEEMYEWGALWAAGFDIASISIPPLVQGLVRSFLSRYSETLALDLWVGQKDRNSDRNVLFGIDPGDLADSAFMFLDHSSTLNFENRWEKHDWTTIETVPVPEVFRASLSKPQLMRGAENIAAMPDDAVRSIVLRVPTEFVPEQHRQVICDGLVGRKHLVRDFVATNF